MAQLRGIDEKLERARKVAPRRRREPEPPQSDALPARIADLATESKGVLEARFRRLHVAECEVDLGAKRLRPRHERDHAPRLDLCERLVEEMDGVLDLPPHQVKRPSSVSA